MNGKPRCFAALFCLIAFGTTHVGNSTAVAETVFLDSLQLAPAIVTTNILDISVDAGALGSDSDQTELSGSVMAMLDLDLSSGEAIATGLSFTGGSIQFSDISLSFALGLITAESSSIAGTVFTPIPPGLVEDSVFDASQHLITLNQGTFSAAGESIDLSAEPIAAAGVGDGAVVITPVGPPIDNQQTYDIELSIDVALADTFFIEDAPVLGTAEVDIIGNGEFVVRDQFTLSLSSIPGEFRADGRVDVSDLNLTLFNWNASRDQLPPNWVDQRPAVGEIVSSQQLNDVLFHWQDSAAVNVVPEPSSLLLCVLAVCTGRASTKWRNRRQ